MKNSNFKRKPIKIAALHIALHSTLLTAFPTIALANDNTNAIEEVVITARKREESLQDTPIAVSAFSGDRLEDQGITKITRLQDLTPNLVFQNTPSNSGVGSNAAVYIRGIGQNDFAPTREAGVGIYVDGVYLGRSAGSVFDMIDLQQVEILRGPQGTLFGRNTIGGAISITTKKPDNETSGKFDVKVGTDGRQNVRGSLNFPLSDTFFMRGSLASFEQDGYVTRPFDGIDLGNQENLNGRLAFRWLASDSLKLDLAMEYGEDKTNGPPVVITRVDTPAQTPNSLATFHNAFAGGGNPGACFGPGASADCYNDETVLGGRDTNFGNGNNFSDLETSGVSLTVDWEGDNIRAKSIIAVRSIDGDFAQDRDGGFQLDGAPTTPAGAAGPQRNPLNQVTDTFVQDQLSVELQLQGTAFDEKLNWLLGLYHFEEDGENINNVEFAVVSIQSGGFFDYESQAIFAQTTYDFTDRFNVTLGIRYTEEDRDYLPDQFFEEIPSGVAVTAFPCFAPGNPVPLADPCMVGDRVVPFETVNNSIEETTPYLNFSYDLSDSVMTYVTYSEGFKSDGFTQRVFPPEPSLPRFEPEFVESYEIGLKGEFLDSSLRINAAVFTTDYTDLQLLVSDSSRIGPFVTNAGDASLQGVELEANWIPVETWRIDIGIGYLDAEYDSLTPGAIAAGLTLDSPFTLISEWNINASIDKTFYFEGGSTLRPRIDWNWRSEFYTNANGIPFRPGIADPLFQPSYHVFNANISWTSATEQYAVTAGVDNLNDEEYRIFGDYQPGFGFDMEAFNRGRQWYLTVGYTF